MTRLIKCQVANQQKKLVVGYSREALHLTCNETLHIILKLFYSVASFFNTPF